MGQKLMYKINDFFFETVGEKDSECVYMSDFLDAYTMQQLKEHIAHFNILQFTALPPLGFCVHLKLWTIRLADTFSISHSS